MKKILIFLFICSVNSISFSQTPFYTDFRTSDGFTENELWVVTDKMCFRGGVYSKIYKNTINEKFDKNFNFSATVSYIEGSQSISFGLFFRFVDTENYMSFEISDIGFFRVSKKVNGKWFDLTSWKKSTLIKSKASNKISVTCENKVVKAYINGINVGSYNDTVNYSSKMPMGLIVNGGVMCCFTEVSVYDIINKIPITDTVDARKIDFSKEEFFVLSNHWLIENGRMVLKNGVGSAYYFNVPFDEFKKNYELSVYAKWESGDKNNGFGLIFNFIDNNNFCEFGINKDGKARVMIKQNGEWIPIFPWTKTTSIKDGENFLKMTVKNSKADFYINNDIIFTTSLPKINQEYINVGVGCDGTVSCSFDYFRVQEFN